MYIYCFTNSISFPYHAGGSADNTAMRVSQLYQDDLPTMYQRGTCPNGDLQERPTGGRGGRGFINSPYVFLMNIFILISIFVLVN